MRASYVGKISSSEGGIELLTGDCLHHLLNVARVQEGQALKLLDGQGKTALGVIRSISKKSVEVHIEEIKKFEREPEAISVAFAQPKKDALESCLRSSVETGAKEIFLLQSKRSQSYRPNLQRYQKILETALEQSNNPFMPKLNISSIQELKFDDYNYCALASLRANKRAHKVQGNGLLVIGPEGGFTEEEENLIFSHQNALALHFKGPILRTQTAIPFFMGFLRHSNVEA